jgi:hypothetical protein
MKEDEMGQTCSSHREMRNLYEILLGNPHANRGDLGIDMRIINSAS